ncbi:MAG: ELWxxDGT repeat protein [Chloroflexota bacterium]
MWKTNLYKMLGLILFLLPATLTVDLALPTAPFENSDDQQVSSYEPYLVSDIASGTRSSIPKNMIELDAITYFEAINADIETALWRSDGTSEGTWPLKSLRLNNPFNDAIQAATTLNGKLYFIGSDLGGGLHLWRSDGTSEGTVIIKSGDFNWPFQLVSFQDQLFFPAENEQGRELWHSDGTSQGTKLFVDLEAGEASSSPRDLVVWNDQLLFSATLNGTVQLWQTDGTTAGTEFIKEIAERPQGPEFFAPIEEALAFQVGRAPVELWRTDGTSDGTYRIKTVVNNDVLLDGPTMVTIDNIVYFQGIDDTFGQELWRSDGTPEGTYMLKDIYPGMASSAPEWFTAVDDTLYFRARSPEYGIELWKSDGSEVGTELVHDLEAGDFSSMPHNLVNFQGKLFFGLEQGFGLWQSDGTRLGTTLFNDELAHVRELHVFGDKLLFSGETEDSGHELWQSDGTLENTNLVKDVNLLLSADADSKELTLFQDKLYFFAKRFAGDSHGLWVTDGSDAGTQLIQEGMPARGFSQLTVAGDKLYFVGGDHELWRSDVTEVGTAVLKPFSATSRLRDLTAVGDDLYFTVHFESSLGWEGQLWYSDGTDTDPIYLKTLDFSTRDGFVAAGEHLYFHLDNEQLWRSNGTAEGTIQLSDPDPFNTRYVELVGTPTHLFFSYVSELWKLDPATDVMQPLLTDGSLLEIRMGVFENDTTLYFSSCCRDGTLLWKTDGTLEGTLEIATVNENPSRWTYHISNMTMHGDTLYFSAYQRDIESSEIDELLWRSDDTSSGTYVIKKLLPEVNSSSISSLTAAGSYFYFVGNDKSRGKELWQSDGTTDGTVLLTSFSNEYQEIAELTPFNTQLFFVMDHQNSGREIWSLHQPSLTERIYLPAIGSE